jgi:hypothetical protein
MTIFISTFCNGIYVHIHTRKGLAQTRSSLPAPKWLKSSTIRRTLSSQVSKHSYHQFTTCNDIFPCHPRISLTVRLHADMPVSADEPAGLSRPGGHVSCSVAHHCLAVRRDGNGVRRELCVPFDDWTSWFGCRCRDGEDDWTSWLEQHQQAT